MKKLYFILILLMCVAIPAQQYITVDYKTPEQLVKEVLIGSRNSSCITISNVSAKGWNDYGNNPFSYGYFEKGTLPFGIEKGIILSTGNVFSAPGPNTSTLNDGNTHWPGDSDLEEAIAEARPSINATVLEFDFVVHNSTGISFQYMFLSEEYYPDNCNYSDAFAFLIKKSGSSEAYENIALVPNTGKPVSVTSVNASCGVHSQYFGGFNNEQAAMLSPTNFNGQTKLLTASKNNVVPGEIYHIKLIIADHINYRYDSAVFLKAGSFVGRTDLGPDLLISSGTAVCQGENLLLDATVTGAHTYQWYKDNMLIPGAISAQYEINAPGYYEVEIDNGGCILKGSKKIEYAEKPVFSNTNAFCNYNEGKSNIVDLQDLNREIISNYQPYFKVKYYLEESDATAGNDNTITELSYQVDTPIYVRAESSTCAAETKTIIFKTPARSALLEGEVICADATVILRTEETFINYKWMDEAGVTLSEGPSENEINVGIGKYSVELTSPNGCTLKQDVMVHAAAPPIITRIDVVGNTATVFVQGGKPPYTITNSWNNEVLTDSNVFRNIPAGKNTVYVTDAKNCETVAKDLLLLNVIKVITPNGDGKNDALDYSELKMKNDVQIEIFDRYGSKVYKARDQRFILDGKLNGVPLPTATYWYTIRWTEPDSGAAVEYKGWILLKNRN